MNKYSNKNQIKKRSNQNKDVDKCQVKGLPDIYTNDVIQKNNESSMIKSLSSKNENPI